MRYFYLFTIAARVTILVAPYFMGKSNLIFWIIWFSIFPIFLFFYEMAGGSNARYSIRSNQNEENSENIKVVYQPDWNSTVFEDGHMISCIRGR